ncbi:transmembrane 220 family protein [Mucilaginibacter myungsuensis]|uniref:Transmembrane 220 family protein n=1 Tax=Mucilaginibacter myungsuensis TaxID=649104 RepID=A0A929PW65_9SPHI|nr:transmembrane 220 family protein [Mucilaginibacter myungsuensis]MBE9660847.1 transmembrane 220 family protein [Mucilaginibacter myungsuensis]MDN3600894.1 transmembrane 220 family protein [Mucilaginibacter myungsuensis]
MKIFNWIFIVLFAISAGLQYNDPDPYIWAPIYLYAAYLCYEASRGRYNSKLYIAGLLVYGSYALYLFLDKNGVVDWFNEHHAESIVQTMKAEKPWIEETREFGGLAICIVVLIANMIWFKGKRQP